MVDDGLVERLHAQLAEALRRARPEPFGSPVTVAEIYQDLVPYRSVRTVLGFQMNADYEHTLLRLLAGEGGHARLEPTEARDELRAELETPNPNVGLFRKFAACDVWITPAELPAGTVEPLRPASPGASVQPAWESKTEWVEPVAKPADDWDSFETELLLEEEVEVPDTSEDLEISVVMEDKKPGPTKETTSKPEPAIMFETRSHQAPVADAGTSACAFCRTGLPAGRMVRYCPFCGSDQSMKPCPTCREPLDPAWKFCIACGKQQG